MDSSPALSFHLACAVPTLREACEMGFAPLNTSTPVDQVLTHSHHSNQPSA